MKEIITQNRILTTRERQVFSQAVNIVNFCGTIENQDSVLYCNKNIQISINDGCILNGQHLCFCNIGCNEQIHSMIRDDFIDLWSTIQIEKRGLENLTKMMPMSFSKEDTYALVVHMGIVINEDDRKMAAKYNSWLLPLLYYLNSPKSKVAALCRQTGEDFNTSFVVDDYRDWVISLENANTRALQRLACPGTGILSKVQAILKEGKIRRGELEPDVEDEYDPHLVNRFKHMDI